MPLSEYEQQRLRNIARNQAALVSLGLAKSALELSAEREFEDEAKKAKYERRKRDLKAKQERGNAGSRRSGRLAGQNAEQIYVERELSGGKIEVVGIESMADASVLDADIERERDADELPEKPEHLSELELKIYEMLRKHRLSISRELGLEPYKIANNRTLCEMVRVLPGQTSDLLGIWGLGAAKVKNYGQGLIDALLPHIKTLRSGQKRANAECDTSMTIQPRPKRARAAKQIKEEKREEEEVPPQVIKGAGQSRGTKSGGAGQAGKGGKAGSKSAPSIAERHRLQGTGKPGVKVAWLWASTVCFGVLLAKGASKGEYRYARTKNNNTKTLKKGADYWWCC
jgi:hypothetical protein